MKQEKVSEDICVFTSDIYAQVNAGAVFTPAGVIVIDTLPFPEETKQMRQAILALSQGQRIRYVVNTHRHGDHTHGNCFFEEAEVVAHQLCREALLKWGQESLTAAKRETPELAEVELRIPEITFDHEMSLHLGGKVVELRHLPGHTPDLAVALVKNDKVLFAGDAVMPIPYIVWGDGGEFITSLQAIREMPLENIVQGHGDVLLRGEIRHTIARSVAYLKIIQDRVKRVLETGGTKADLGRIDIEECGVSPIALDGIAKRLHRDNLLWLYESQLPPDS
ncbi:MAG: MBL fold metallo-hydrolase [Anaerolineae bacterium]